MLNHSTFENLAYIYIKFGKSYQLWQKLKIVITAAHSPTQWKYEYLSLKTLIICYHAEMHDTLRIESWVHYHGSQWAPLPDSSAMLKTLSLKILITMETGNLLVCS